MNDSPPSRQRFWLVFLLFLHTVNTYMDRVCISVAKGDMQNDISGLDDQMMGYVFGIFAIGYALFQIPAGWFSDRAGPRHALTIVVIIWSIFTALTGYVFTAISLLVVRFLFGVGEAGAYPGATRALYSWLPAKERGLGQGIFHSGARVGAAASLVLMPMLIDAIGWRMTFVANALLGLLWGAVWWVWYRNDPADHVKVNSAEADLISKGLDPEVENKNAKLPYIQVVTSANVLLAMFQYAASNITFFISITWLQPYLRETYGDQYAYLASLPLLCGAVALWISGYAVTYLHRRGMHVLSRRLPAMLGYALGATGLLLCTQVSGASVWVFIGCFALATFGVEMTLSPSWAFCMDIGGTRSGAVSAAMNMVGNMGAAVSAVAFPYCVANVTLPVIAETTGTANSFFAFAAAMNLLAMIAWCFMNPLRQLKEISTKALTARLAIFLLLISLVLSALVYTKFYLPKNEQPKSEPANVIAADASAEEAQD